MSTYGTEAAAHLLSEAIDLVSQALNVEGLERSPATIVMGEALVALMAAEGMLTDRHADASADDSQATATAGFRKACNVILLRSGFERWGEGGWIRDDENGGTCYDTAWALERADLPKLAATYGEVFEERPALSAEASQ